MGATQSIYSSSSTNSITDKSQLIVHHHDAQNLDFRNGSRVPIYRTPHGTQELVTIQPPPMIQPSGSLYSTDQLRAYNKAYLLAAKKSRRMVSYFLTQARLNGKSEFIKTLYTSCIARCIPQEHHSSELDQKWMYQILSMIQSEFRDCQVDVISSGREYLTIRFRSGV